MPVSKELVDYALVVLEQMIAELEHPSDMKVGLTLIGWQLIERFKEES